MARRSTIRPLLARCRRRPVRNIGIAFTANNETARLKTLLRNPDYGGWGMEWVLPSETTITMATKICMSLLMAATSSTTTMETALSPMSPATPVWVAAAGQPVLPGSISITMACLTWWCSATWTGTFMISGAESAKRVTVPTAILTSFKRSLP